LRNPLRSLRVDVRGKPTTTRDVRPVEGATMPIYEYQCSKCGRLEIFRRITDGPLARCPACGRKVTKLISQSSFHLKGGGWYVTDYARKGSNEATTSDTVSASDTGSASAGGNGTSSTTKKDGKKSPPASGETSGADPATT
jgi:putative FmdB family regulatory protein